MTDRITIPTLTDTMAAELVGKPGGDLAAARARLAHALKNAGNSRRGTVIVNREALSLILALPDREALARELRAHGEFGTTETRNHENSLSCADAILSLLKGESHD